MRQKRRRYRIRYQGEAEVMASSREEALDKMDEILYGISDVYEINDNNCEIDDIEECWEY